MKKTSLYRKVLRYQQDNLACARIVIADPAKYPGVLQEYPLERKDVVLMKHAMAAVYLAEIEP
jgi:hypothetical protein